MRCLIADDLQLECTSSKALQGCPAAHLMDPASLLLESGSCTSNSHLPPAAFMILPVRTVVQGMSACCTACSRAGSASTASEPPRRRPRGGAAPGPPAQGAVCGPVQSLLNRLPSRRLHRVRQHCPWSPQVLVKGAAASERWAP